MNSPLRKIIVFDLETGGFDYKINSITEAAGVVIDTETLQIIDEMSVMIRPYMDLRSILEESNKEAKRLFNLLATPGEEGKVKSLLYGKKEITLKSLDSMIRDIEVFHEYLSKRKSTQKGVSERIFTYEEYLELREGDHKNIAEIYFNSTYNPQALEATHMSIDLLLKEGVSYQEACEKFKNFQLSHTVGTNKPIMAGHNIKGFDLPFMIKLYADCGFDFLKLSNDFILDTLEWARLRWFELSSFSLGVCANTLGLTLKEAHRALPDTIANAKFLVALLKSMRGEGSQESTYVRRKFDFYF
jgi:DNA polymerase III alpha subunit (gram-positive type)